MKKIILLCGALLLLMPFVLQYGHEQANYRSIAACTNIVDTYKVSASELGAFTPELITGLKRDIANQLKDVEEVEVVVNATTSTKYKSNRYAEDQMIEYEIGIPVKKIIAANSFWGVSDEDNEMLYFIKGKIASEVLKP